MFRRRLSSQMRYVPGPGRSLPLVRASGQGVGKIPERADLASNALPGRIPRRLASNWRLSSIQEGPESHIFIGQFNGVVNHVKRLKKSGPATLNRQ